MAQKWNEHNLLRLLLLAINDFQGNFTELASEWAKRYPDDEFQPTARAIQEKLKVLKKAADPSSTVAITGSKWSEVNLLKLLMLAMGNIKSNFVELAAQWAKRYPDEPFKPTPRAIQEKLKALKKSVDAPSSSSSAAKTARPQSNPLTPKKRPAPKSSVTSGSSSKRSKEFDAMKLGSDTDDENDIFASPSTRSSVKREVRQTPTRKTKRITVIDGLPSDDSDFDDGRVANRADSPATRNVSNMGGLPIGDVFAGLIKLNDGDIIINSRHAAGVAQKDSFEYFDQFEDDTDVSNFVPGAY